MTDQTYVFIFDIKLNIRSCPIEIVYFHKSALKRIPLGPNILRYFKLS